MYLSGLGMTEQEYRDGLAAIAQIDSRAAQAVKRTLFQKRYIAEKKEAQRAAWTQQVRDAIQRRLKTINGIAEKMVTADVEETFRLGAGIDDWKNAIGEEVSPGLFRSAERLKQQDNYRPKDPNLYFDAVMMAAMLDSIIDSEMVLATGHAQPYIGASLINRKFGAGAYEARMASVGSMSWWDRVGVPIIQAALFAYVGGGILDSLGAGGGAAGGGAGSEVGAAAVPATTEITVAGLGTGYTTGVAAIDTAIGAAVTAEVGSVISGPQQPQPQPQSQPQPQALQTSQSIGGTGADSSDGKKWGKIVGGAAALVGLLSLIM